MDKIIGFKYVKDNDMYKYDSIVNSIDEAKVNEEYNVINVDFNIIDQISKGNEDKLLSYEYDSNKPILIKVDANSLKYLVDQSMKTKNLSEEEAYKFAVDGIESLFKKIEKIEPVNNNGIVYYNIKYHEVKKENEETKDDKKTLEVNGKKEDKSTVASSDVITSIDISTIDPKELNEKIKNKVVAQDIAVEALVNNIYNNQKVINSENPDLISTSKVNIFVDGPTGTGKTLMVKSIAKELNLPINIVPATIFSAPGYKGADLEEMLIPLLDKTGGNVELAQRGIIVLDEFDKLASKGDSSLEMNKAVQHNLLTYIGGSKIPIEYNGKKIEFDTSNITFICLGAFTDLRERKIKESGESGIYNIVPEDYIEEGILRETIGRFSLLTSTQGLGKEALKKILLESNISPLKNMIEVGKLYDKNIIVNDDMVNAIVDKAYEMKTGARALQTVINGIQNIILNDIMDPDKEKDISVTEEVLEEYNKGTLRGESK